ncbi:MULTISPECIES: lasso peptide biosynthesis PqqD family chaperone [Bacillus]|uniref:Metallophosphoesterase n=2 Tax=Bacillus TaxID=1386 RepID=A0A0M3RA56_9BACI|nr:MULTISPECIES: lasso peptide biosynthesis PqqD family chaperone [Bacillus]ALC82602.1 metallophosphoesterase [Bacillus gobiensis]MBP1081533.1 hypothetical protein [Bacillus capparidis]MED1096199.1 lasso peptide biosynthesis PqqD family chaperone [Bacillus capparidis]
MDKKITPDSVVAQNEGYIASNMDGEKVMMSIKNSKYYNLGEIGGAIWDAAVRPIKVSDLVTHLQSEYDVNREQCERQVIAFLENLQKEGLIQSGKGSEVM